MPTSDKIVAKALSYVGTKESPANSNNVIFNTDYYGKPVNGSAYPWCAAFVWDIFRMCNAEKLITKTAYCPTMENFFKNKGAYHSKPKVGDVCFMDFGKGRASHVGIVVEVISGGVKTVEGNTSTTNNDNGGSVMIRTRKSNIRGYGRPEYGEDHKIAYNGHIQDIGWQAPVYDGATCGTEGQGRRLEAIHIDTRLSNLDIYAKAHIQDTGWYDYGKINNDTIIGTVGRADAIECICLNCTNADLEYRVHIQDFGWTPWTKADGIASLGTVGQSLRLEAIQMKIG